MYISVVILTCNQQALTMRCLGSLASFIADDECEVILVDNGSTDGTIDMVHLRFPKVKTIALPENRGVAAGRNVGLGAASGEYLMILDNDTVADRHTIFALADYLRRHPEVGLVAPKLVSPQGEVQTSYKRFPGLGVKIGNIMRGARHTSVSRKIPMREMEPFYLIGAAQMFPRDVYHMAGPLDENIFYGPEDADFCMSVRSVWKRIVYLPSLTIVHDWQRATTRRVLSPAGRRHIAGLLYFYAKHRRLF